MICLHPECNNTSRTRGLCHNCYQACRDRIRQGKADEDDLVRRRLLTPKGMGGTKSGGSPDVFNQGRTETGRKITWLVDFGKVGDPYTGHAREVTAWTAEEAKNVVLADPDTEDVFRVRSMVA